MLVLIAAGFCAFLVGMCFKYISSQKYAAVVRHKEEECFYDPFLDKTVTFPSLDDPATISLSVIVPAYCEENRLPVMLDECLLYLEKKLSNDPQSTYEVIIVDDGSKDKTTEVALNYSKQYGCDKVRVLTLVQNRGKGGAVRLGMLSSRGKQLLFADADGATKFEDISKLQTSLSQLKEGHSDELPAVVCGSRAHLEKEAIATRSIARNFLMKGFHLLVWLFAVRSIRDTQCGFKLLTRPAARILFPSLHIERWAFDVELLYIAETLRIPTSEVAVRWTEIEGSKIVPFWSWLQMGRDLILIWLRYNIGVWKIKDQEKVK
nr:EOG090X0BIY [Cyclestheria hislopi]